MSSDEEKLQAAIPAEFHMISGSQDRQTSADVFNVNKVRKPSRMELNRTTGYQYARDIPSLLYIGVLG